MSFSNSAETDALKLIFQAVTWGDIAENDTTAPASNLYVSLHTADPGDTGSQTTSEATYTSYARVAVARTTGGWAVSSGNADNVAAITFPQCSGGSNTITHVGIGTGSSGAGYLICSGALTASLAVSNGITPEFAIGSLDCSLD